jgi:hypothetical protein
LHISWADTRVVPIGVAIIALDAFMYGAVGARCGFVVLQMPLTPLFPLLSRLLGWRYCMGAAL